MHAVVAEVFAHRAAGVGREELHRRRIGRGGGHDDGVFHRAVVLERLHDLGDRRALLANGHVNAVELLALVAALVDRLLVQEGVDGDGGLAGLAVADDQLALAAADRDQAVDRIAETVDHAAEQALADRNVDDGAGTLDGVAFADRAILAEDHDADVVALEIERHALDAARELDHLAGLDAVETVDARDAVTNGKDLADLGHFGLGAEVGDLLLQNGRDFGGTDIHLGNSLHGKLQALQLAANRRIEQARTNLHQQAAEDVGVDARVDGNLGIAQHLAQRIGELLQLGGRERHRRGDRGGGLAAATRQLGKK